jgi:hypothetical protein
MKVLKSFTKKNQEVFQYLAKIKQSSTIVLEGTLFFSENNSPPQQRVFYLSSELELFMILKNVFLFFLI